MANISSINGNPIVLSASGLTDGSIPDSKLVQSGGVVSKKPDYSNFMEFEQGSLTNASGEKVVSAVRIRSVGFHAGKYCMTVPDGFRILTVVYYDESTHEFDSAVQLGSYIYTEYEVYKEGCVSKVVVSKTNSNEEITPEDINLFDPLAKADRQIEYLNNAVFSEQTIAGSDWSRKAVIVSNGTIQSSTTRLLYKDGGYLEDYIAALVPSEGYAAALYAYQNGTYLGCLTDSEELTKAIINLLGRKIDVAGLRNKYPNYDFRLVLSKQDSSTITTSDTDGLLFLVSSAEEHISNLEKSKFDFDDLVWQYGSVNTSGQLVSANNRIRTVGFVEVDAGTTITPTDSSVLMQIIKTYRPAQYPVVSYVSFTSEKYTETEHCFIRIVLRYANNSDISDFSNLVSMFNCAGLVNIHNMLPVEMIRKKSIIRKVSSCQEVYLFDGTYYSVVNSLSDFYGRWNSLMESNSQYISRESIGLDASGTYDIYCYTIDSHSDVFKYNRADVAGSEKSSNLKIIWIGDMHGGTERYSATDDFCFFNDLVSNHDTDKVLGYIWRNATIMVVPTMNPWGYQNGTRWNSNLVNLNRNFDTYWRFDDSDQNNYSGPSANSEAETQAIINLLDWNRDALLVVNRHTSGTPTQTGVLGYIVSKFISDREVADVAFKDSDYIIKSSFDWILGDRPASAASNLICSYFGQSYGAMDGWYNDHGFHGFLLELGPSGLYGTDYPSSTAEDIRAINCTIAGNLLKCFIEHNADVLSNDEYDVNYIDGNWV